MHWSLTTTETKEDVSLRSPDASHTIVKSLILTGTRVPSLSPGGTMARAMSPSVDKSVVSPRSLTVMSGHDALCAFAKDIKARPS